MKRLWQTNLNSLVCIPLVNEQLITNKIAEIYKIVNEAFVKPNVHVTGSLCDKSPFYSFLQSLRQIEQILQQSPTPPRDCEQIELTDIPIVLSSFNSNGHPPYIGPLLPDEEKLVSHPLKLGHDIRVL